MRARLRLCVVTHTRELFFSIQRGKKKRSTLTFTEEKAYAYAKANTQQHQTTTTKQSHSDGTRKSSGVFFEREALNARCARATVLEIKKNSTFFSQKKVINKKGRGDFSSSFSTLRKVYHHTY